MGPYDIWGLLADLKARADATGVNEETAKMYHRTLLEIALNAYTFSLDHRLQYLPGGELDSTPCDCPLCASLLKLVPKDENLVARVEALELSIIDLLRNSEEDDQDKMILRESNRRLMTEMKSEEFKSFRLGTLVKWASDVCRETSVAIVPGRPYEGGKEAFLRIANELDQRKKEILGESHG